MQSIAQGGFRQDHFSLPLGNGRNVEGGMLEKGLESSNNVGNFLSNKARNSKALNYRNVKEFLYLKLVANMIQVIYYVI